MIYGQTELQRISDPKNLLFFQDLDVLEYLRQNGAKQQASTSEDPSLQEPQFKILHPPPPANNNSTTPKSRKEESAAKHKHQEVTKLMKQMNDDLTLAVFKSKKAWMCVIRYFLPFKGLSYS